VIESEENVIEEKVDVEIKPTVKFSDIVEHIFDLPSLDGIAPIVASLSQSSIDRLVRETNSNRETILHMATIKNNIECVRFTKSDIFDILNKMRKLIFTFSLIIF